MTPPLYRDRLALAALRDLTNVVDQLRQAMWAMPVRTTEADVALTWAAKILTDVRLTLRAVDAVDEIRRGGRGALQCRACEGYFGLEHLSNEGLCGLCALAGVEVTP